ncbi:MAG: hypothetical protein WBB19_08365 [Desulforhopalus sp.]
MRSRFCYIFISIIVIFIVGLGTSLAGKSLCPPDCPDCRVTPACCAKMAENSVGGTGGMSDHQPGPDGCSHDGICLDGVQPVDLAGVSGTVGYDSVLAHSHPESPGRSDFSCIVEPPFHLKPPKEKFPPLYIQNCSFLI